MAKRTPVRGDNRDDLELKKFTYDPVENKSYINIDDEDIVDAISDIGGNSPTVTDIVNESLVANTELEIDCGADVKYILVRSRTNKRLKLAYSIGNTAIEYITLERGTVYTDDAFYTILKIYLLCEAADTVEILIKRNA
jgi:hypothetical protein